MGDGFRWLTVGHPSQPELHLTLMRPGPPLDDEPPSSSGASSARVTLGGIGLTVDDCRKTYEELSAKGVEFVQEPSDRPYGVEAIVRDNSGNWIVLMEPKAYSLDDFK